MSDGSNGYDACASHYIASRSSIGASTVRAWTASLPRGASVLDVGCGHGIPVTQALVDAGCRVSALDASPALVAAFRTRFPDVPIACEPAESAASFTRHHDAVVAWGLLFLLTPDGQRRVIENAAGALKPGGQFLFTAPADVCSWTDVLTGKDSTSLGAEAYRALLADVGLVVRVEGEDEGGNHYYIAVRAAARPTSPAS